MNLDLAHIVSRLSERPGKVFAAALVDPDLAKEAGLLGYVLQLLGPAIDEAPGRLRRQATDAEELLRRYAALTNNAAKYDALLAQEVNWDRLSGLLARTNILNAALIEMEEALEAEEADWAQNLKRDILATYLKWTEIAVPSRDTRIVD